MKLKELTNIRFSAAYGVYISDTKSNTILDWDDTRTELDFSKLDATILNREVIEIHECQEALEIVVK